MMDRTPTTGPWESRPIGTKGDIGIYVLNARPSCGVIARTGGTGSGFIENTGRRPMLKSVGGEDAA